MIPLEGKSLEDYMTMHQFWVAARLRLIWIFQHLKQLFFHSCGYVQRFGSSVGLLLLTHCSSAACSSLRSAAAVQHLRSASSSSLSLKAPPDFLLVRSFLAWKPIERERGVGGRERSFGTTTGPIALSARAVWWQSRVLDTEGRWDLKLFPNFFSVLHFHCPTQCTFKQVSSQL